MSEEKDQNVHRLRIWNHPESRIAFLETVLKDKDWEAVIYEPPKGMAAAEDASKSLEEIQKELRKKDYHTQLGTDEEGNATLTIKHFGNERGLVKNIQELGLAGGWSRTIDHLPDVLRHTGAKVQEGYDYVTSDKARLLSGLYLAGDAMMLLAGTLNKSEVKDSFADRIKKPENSLHMLSGALAIAQSLIFMSFAKDGSEIHLANLKNHMDAALQNGIPPSDVLKYKVGEERQGDNFISSFVKRHPIEVGAVTQIVGGGSFIASSLIKHGQAGVSEKDKLAMKHNIAGSVASMLGWGVMMYPAKEHAGADGVEPNVFQKHPETFASALEMGANALRLRGGMIGEETKNPVQVASESAFMLGDLTMLFVHNNEYGAHGAANTDMTSKAAATFIASMPMVLGQEEEQKFIGDLSNYLARQIVDDRTSSPRPSPTMMNADLAEDEHVKVISAEIAKATRKELMGKQRKLGIIVNAAASLAHTFPDEEQSNVITKLSEAISGMAGVYVQKDRLRELIDAEERTLVMIDEGGGSKFSARPKMNDIAKHISAIVTGLPPLNAAENAASIYDVLAPMIETSPRDGIYMERAMKEHVAEKTGVSPHMLAAGQSSSVGSAARV